MTKTRTNTEPPFRPQPVRIDWMATLQQEAKTHLAETGAVPSIYLLIRDDGQFVFIEAWWDDTGKREAIADLRDLVRRNRVVRYLHLAECWAGVEKRVQPAKDPNRKEVVMITVADKATHSATATIAAIARDAHGKPSLGPWEESRPRARNGDQPVRRPAARVRVDYSAVPFGERPGYRKARYLASMISKRRVMAARVRRSAATVTFTSSTRWMPRLI